MVYHVALPVLDLIKIIINILLTNKSYFNLGLFGKGKMSLTMECWIRLLDVLLPTIYLSLCRIKTLGYIIEALFLNVR